MGNTPPLFILYLKEG